MLGWLRFFLPIFTVDLLIYGCGLDAERWSLRLIELVVELRQTVRAVGVASSKCCRGQERGPLLTLRRIETQAAFPGPVDKDQGSLALLPHPG